MGTLASGLGQYAEGLTQAPRVYCDANLTVGLVRFMRERLRWDVFFVMKEEDLRRAADVEHFNMASQLRRTLLTMDHDYLDDVRFPLARCSGVLVLSAADEAQLERPLTQVDRVLFRQPADKKSSADATRMPLLGRKLLVNTGWTGEMEQS